MSQRYSPYIYYLKKQSDFHENKCQLAGDKTALSIFPLCPITLFIYWHLMLTDSQTLYALLF